MRMWSNSRLLELIDSEGIGYAVQSYLNADQIEDPRAASLWRVAAEALNALEAYLEPFGEDDED